MNPTALRLATTFALAACLLPLGGCLPTAEQVRRVTYPPDFRYMPRGDVNPVMWSLARHVSELDGLMRESDGLDAEPRARAIALLASMESEARSLQMGAQGSNHPMLDQHLPAFVERLGKARADLERDPPHAFLAGTVAGACLTCHGGSRSGPGES